MQHDDTLTGDNIIVLRQGLELLGQLDDIAYLELKHPFSSHGVGSHFRHCLDFYHCFLAGVWEGRIDYDVRERDQRLAKERLFAVAKFTEVLDALLSFPADLGPMPLLVRLEQAGDAQYPSAWSHSSVLRELQSLVSHTVHHYALIALMLRLNGFTPSEEFGVAPSTLQHWRKQLACAR